MASTTPQGLLAQANCFLAYGRSQTTFLAMEVALLTAYVNGTSVGTTPQALLSQANCILEYGASPQTLEAMIIVLLTLLVQQGGSFVSITTGTSAPSSPPNNPNVANIFYLSGGPPNYLYVWDTSSQTWNQL